MVLQLSGRWVWDFWLAADRGLWHVFYLYAVQAPDDPDKRHFSARIAPSSRRLGAHFRGERLATFL